MSNDGEMQQVLWTLKIQGPALFTAQPSGNPVIQHEGGDSSHTLVLSGPEVRTVVALIESHGLRAEAHPMQGQSPLQTEERGLLVGQQERVWPCIYCPSCSWLDPLQAGSPCGVVSWPAESIRTLRATSEKHRADELLCPIHGFTD